MSQEPVAEDFKNGTADVVQPPWEEARETDPDEEPEIRVEEDVLDAEDVEELESTETKGQADTFRQPDVGTGPSGDVRASQDEIVAALRRVREDVGQICELSSEEGKIVEAFSLGLLRLMQPLAKAIPVNPSALPRELGDIKSANIIPKGELIILYADGGMESIDLSDEANRDLLVEVIMDVMPKFAGFIAERRVKIERRMGFLASVTRELQNISEAFSSAIG